MAEESNPRSGKMPAVWYLADMRGRIGPLSLGELKDTLATLPDANDVLVWAKHLPDWKRVRDVPELVAVAAPLDFNKAFAEALSSRFVENPAPTGSAEARSNPQVQPSALRVSGAKPNYIFRHWRGELSLPLSYWVNGVGLGLVAAFAAEVVILYMNPTLSELIALRAAYLSFFGWAWTGIWRSAGRRTPNGPDGWGWAARAAIILAAIRIASDLIGGRWLSEVP
jgi:hypothetical protein